MRGGAKVAGKARVAVWARLGHLGVSSSLLRAVLSVAALGLVCFGCGSGRATTRTVVQTVVEPAAQTSTSVARAPTSGHHRRWKSCDQNIRARIGTTSCGFAENVFYRFWRASQLGDDTFAAYSPITDHEYRMSCRGRSTIVCTAGDGGAVRFSRAAVDAYSADQADAYCNSHKVSATAVPCDASPSDATPPAASTPDANSNCDPSYTGACLDPDATDYDCEGGSGDGPEYTGTVTVVGDDHYGLDRDGDGVACEG